MPIALNGSTSGQVTIEAPAVAGTTTVTLPATSGTLAITAEVPAAYTDADALSLFNASGSAPVYAVRAWVNFNGQNTVAIRDSGNVSSITDNATGDYTINYTTAMPDENYTVLSAGGPISTSDGVLVGPKGNGLYTTTQLRILCKHEGNPARDPSIVSIGIVR